jgi:dolichol-phosphate mannosyltransferase
MANESRNCVRFVQEVLAHSNPIGRVDFFVVLDNVSRDNTRQLLDDYAKIEKRLRVVWAPENRCIVDAYVRGYRAALASQAEYILEIDAGFSHNPAEIPRFFKAIEDRRDCAFGSRFMPGGSIRSSSLKRKLVSYGGSLLTNLAIGTKLHDMTSGFQLFRRPALQLVLAKGIYSRGHFFQTEMKIHCRNLDVVEVPISYSMASPGLTVSTINESFSQLWRLFKLRVSGKLDQQSEPQECISRPAL